MWFAKRWDFPEERNKPPRALILATPVLSLLWMTFGVREGSMVLKSAVITQCMTVDQGRLLEWFVMVSWLRIVIFSWDL